jgi:hypothetical protein
VPEPTWNLYKTSTPAGGPLSPVGTGATLWDGWIDEQGSKYDLNSSNKLETPGASYTNCLIRPIGEIRADMRSDWTIIEAQPSGHQIQWLRRGAGGDGYLIYTNMGGQDTEFYKISGGSQTGPLTPTSLIQGTGTTSITWNASYNSAHTYLLSARIWGSAPNNLHVVQTDVTAGTVVCEFTFSETDANLAGAGNYGLALDTSTLGSHGAILLYNTDALPAQPRRLSAAYQHFWTKRKALRHFWTDTLSSDSYTLALQSIPGLVSLWELHDDSPTIAVDLAAVPHQGAVQSGVTRDQPSTTPSSPLLSTGFPGSTSSYIEMGDFDAASIVTTGKLSVVASFVPASVTGVQTIVSKAGLSGSDYEWALRLNGTGVELVAWDSVGDTAISALSGTLTIGVKYFVLVSIDQAATPLAQIYIAAATDTSLFNAGSADTGGVVLSNTAGTVEIGRRGDNANAFSGDIDHVALYSIALTPTQASTLFTAWGPQPTDITIEAGNQPSASGTLTRIWNAQRALTGNEPAAGGTLTRILHALRTLTGAEPNATGSLAYFKHAVAALAGAQPASSGALAYFKHVLFSLTGAQPAASGTVTRLLHALRSLAGAEPNATGTLSRLLQAQRILTGAEPNATGTIAKLRLKVLAGAEPAASGTATPIKATSRALAGAEPNATGALGYFKHVIQSLSGAQPSASGTILAVRVTARSIAGVQPAASGTLARILHAQRSLTGSEPNPSGTITRLLHALRVLAGVQPASSGFLRTVKALVGNEPNATGTLTRILHALRILTGAQPAASGTLSRVWHAQIALTGNQPAASATFTGLRSGAQTRSTAGAQPAASGTLSAIPLRARSLTGNQPASSATLARLWHAHSSLVGAQPAASAVLLRSRHSAVALAGTQPSASGILARLLHAQRSLAGAQPSATATLAQVRLVLRALAGAQPSPSGSVGHALHALRVLAGIQPSSSAVLSRLWHALHTLLGNEPSASALPPATTLHTARSATGAQPAATGSLLVQSISVSPHITSSEPAPTGTLSAVRTRRALSAGVQPAAHGSLSTSQSRISAGSQPCATGSLGVIQLGQRTYQARLLRRWSTRSTQRAWNIRIGHRRWNATLDQQRIRIRILAEVNQ